MTSISCARAGKAISPVECADTIYNTQSADDLRACHDCDHGKALGGSAPRWAPPPPDLSGFTDGELWAELHRRHPAMWKRF